MPPFTPVGAFAVLAESTTNKVVFAPELLSASPTTMRLFEVSAVSKVFEAPESCTRKAVAELEPCIVTPAEPGVNNIPVPLLPMFIPVALVLPIFIDASLASALRIKPPNVVSALL